MVAFQVTFVYFAFQVTFVYFPGFFRISRGENIEKTHNPKEGKKSLEVPGASGVDFGSDGYNRNPKQEIFCACNGDSD